MTGKRDGFGLDPTFCRRFTSKTSDDTRLKPTGPGDCDSPDDTAHPRSNLTHNELGHLVIPLPFLWPRHTATSLTKCGLHHLGPRLPEIHLSGPTTVLHFRPASQLCLCSRLPIRRPCSLSTPDFESYGPTLFRRVFPVSRLPTEKSQYVTPQIATVHH